MVPSILSTATSTGAKTSSISSVGSMLIPKPSHCISTISAVSRHPISESNPFQSRVHQNEPTKKIPPRSPPVGTRSASITSSALPTQTKPTRSLPASKTATRLLISVGRSTSTIWRGRVSVSQHHDRGQHRLSLGCQKFGVVAN